MKSITVIDSPYIRTLNQQLRTSELERGNSSRKLLVPVIKRNRADKRSFSGTRKK